MLALFSIKLPCAIRIIDQERKVSLQKYLAEPEDKTFTWTN